MSKVDAPTSQAYSAGVRPLLASRGFTVPVRPDDRLCTLDENKFPDHVSVPQEKSKDDAPLGECHARREQRRRQSSERICVEHTNAEYKQWWLLQR